MRSGTDNTPSNLPPAGSVTELQPMPVASSNESSRVNGTGVPYHQVSSHPEDALEEGPDGIDSEPEIDGLDDLNEEEEATPLPEPEAGLTTMTFQDAEAEIRRLNRDDPEFAALLAISELPEPYDWSSKENFQLLTAIYCTVAASILYYEGSKKLGQQYVVGSLIVNGLQTAFYTKETFGYISKISENKPLAAFASILAGCATLVSTIATYQLAKMDGDSSSWAGVKSLFNASGNLPQNLYGMFASLEIIKKYFENNPQARDYLHKKLRHDFRRYLPLQKAIRRERSSANKVINHVVGVGFGVLLSAGQLGYMRSSVDGVRKVFGNEAVGLTLGLLTNMPSLAISLFISGNNISTGVVNKAFDAANDFADYYRGKYTGTFSRREKSFMLLAFFTFASLIVFARFSGATSLNLYESEPPLPGVPSNEFIDDFERFDVDEGAQLFNAIMSIMAMNSILTYFKEAYVKYTTVDYYKYRVGHMDHAIDTIPAKRAEELAEASDFDVTPVVPFWKRYGIFASTAASANASDDHHFVTVASDEEEKEIHDQQEPEPVAAGYGMLHH